MIRIKVPATSANLGPGFDTLGMALQFYNYFEAAPAPTMSVRLSDTTCVDTKGLSLDPAHNLLAQAYVAYFEHRQTAVIPAALVIDSHIPLSRGMGSSSTAIVGGVMLANIMHPKPLSKADLAEIVVAIEGHPDNVIPALFGGVRCCLSPSQSLALCWPQEWGILLVIPPNPLSTEEARAIMPAHYSRNDVVETFQGITAWLYGLAQANWPLFHMGLQRDRIHEPYRGPLIPEYQLVQSLLGQAHEAACIISGSGSTLAVFTSGLDARNHWLEKLKAHPPLNHCKIISVQADQAGAVVVSSPELTSGSTVNLANS